MPGFGFLYPLLHTDHWWGSVALKTEYRGEGGEG